MAPTTQQYGHEYKAAVWALSTGNPPLFEQKLKLEESNQWQFDMGSSLKPYLADFYTKTDFEAYYENYLTKELNKIKTHIQNIVTKMNPVKILERAWNFKINENTIIIPNPFTHGNFGPQLGDINFQVIGIVDDRYLIDLILHEGSHPIAKKILQPYKKDIEAKENLFHVAKEHPNFSSAYNIWSTCFEEHFIRALQVSYINPKILDSYDVQEGLNNEKNNNGMVFIDTFYKNLQKNEPAKAIPQILRELK